MDYFLLYLILRLDDFSFVTGATTILAFLAFVLLVIIYLSNNIDRTADKTLLNKVSPWIKPTFVIFCIAALLSVVIPTTKQAAVVYCLPKIVNNEQVQKVPDNLLKLANQWIGDQITETTETVTETAEAVIDSVEN